MGPCDRLDSDEANLKEPLFAKTWKKSERQDCEATVAAACQDGVDSAKLLPSIRFSS